MAIPVAYNLRNLVVRYTTTIMTALGVALTVAVLLAIFLPPFEPIGQAIYNLVARNRRRLAAGGACSVE